MHRAAILAILLTSCYDREDAMKQVRAQNRPEPIVCVRNSSDRNGASTSFVCTDAEGWVWLCDSSVCVITWRPQQ